MTVDAAAIPDAEWREFAAWTDAQVRKAGRVTAETRDPLLDVVDRARRASELGPAERQRLAEDLELLKAAVHAGFVVARAERSLGDRLANIACHVACALRYEHCREKAGSSFIGGMMCPVGLVVCRRNCDKWFEA